MYYVMSLWQAGHEPQLAAIESLCKPRESHGPPDSHVVAFFRCANKQATPWLRLSTKIYSSISMPKKVARRNRNWFQSPYHGIVRQAPFPLKFCHRLPNNLPFRAALNRTMTVPPQHLQSLSHRQFLAISNHIMDTALTSKLGRIDILSRKSSSFGHFNSQLGSQEMWHGNNCQLKNSSRIALRWARNLSLTACQTRFKKLLEFHKVHW